MRLEACVHYHMRRLDVGELRHGRPREKVEVDSAAEVVLRHYLMRHEAQGPDDEERRRTLHVQLEADGVRPIRAREREDGRAAEATRNDRERAACEGVAPRITALAA